MARTLLCNTAVARLNTTGYRYCQRGRIQRIFFTECSLGNLAGFSNEGPKKGVNTYRGTIGDSPMTFPPLRELLLAGECRKVKYKRRTRLGMYPQGYNDLGDQTGGKIERKPTAGNRLPEKEKELKSRKEKNTQKRQNVSHKRKE